MQDTEKEVRALLGPIALGMSALGMWQPPGKPLPVFGIVAAVFIIMLDVFVFISVILFLVIDSTSDMEILREAFFICACCLTWGIRIVALLVSQSKVQRLVVGLLDMRKRYAENGAAIRKRYRRRALIVYFVWQGLPSISLPMWVVEPALAPMLVSTPGNASDHLVWRTPLLMWMPAALHTQTSPNYEVAYVVHTLILLTVVETNVFIDLFCAGLMIHLTAEIDVLNQNIANLRLLDTSETTVEATEDNKIRTSEKDPDTSKLSPRLKGNNYDSYATDPNTHMYEKLVKSVQHHQSIMSCLNELESILSESSVLMMVVNSMNICVQAFGFVDGYRQGAQMSTIMKKILTLPSYISQTAHFCWLGQAVIDQSERLVESAFSCGWQEADARFCSSLRIFMLQTSRPLKLQIGKIFTLSRNFFLQILNTSYTIFNMMVNF